MSVLEDLLSIIHDPNRVTAKQEVINEHSFDISYHKPTCPDIVVYPQTKEEVSKILTLASKKAVPIVPYGIGTSVEGQVIPILGGITLNMSMMNKIIEFRPQDSIVRVQPGITRVKLNQFLQPFGFFFSVDPGVDATIGGMAATNASGTNTVRYGVMRDQILGLEVALADGRMIHTGSLAAKSSSGYNLTGLFVGSEGTLGVFTELTLKIKRIPSYSLSARISFRTVKEACEAAISLLDCGLLIGRVELVDEKSVKAVNDYKKTSFIEAPTLFLELHGEQLTVDEHMAVIENMFGSKAEEFIIENESNSKEELWTARHEAALAIAASAPTKKLLTTDVCVPLSVLPEAVCEARKLIEANGIYGAILGHVGDGNYHVSFAINPNDEEEVKLAQNINDHIVSFALNHGGTCSGEHGIGIGKKAYLTAEHGEALDIMKEIKTVLDPNGILNPGKIFC